LAEHQDAIVDRQIAEAVGIGDEQSIVGVSESAQAAIVLSVAPKFWEVKVD